MIAYYAKLSGNITKYSDNYKNIEIGHAKIYIFELSEIHILFSNKSTYMNKIITCEYIKYFDEPELYISNKQISSSWYY